MTPETLANLANNALYSSMVVFTLAMLAFVAHLSARAPRRAQARASARTDALVAAGVGAAADGGTRDARDVARDRAGEPAPGSAAYGPESLRSRQWGSIGLTLTYLATLLLVGSVVLRGVAVARPPWGNMFEFATAAVAAVGVAYSVLARRNRWEWLGVFIVTPILLVLGLAVTVLYTEAHELMPALKSYWLAIHVTVAFLAVSLFTLGAAVGAVYLLRRRREVRPSARPGVIESLPSAAALERTAYSLNMGGFILWTFTLIAGSIWAKQAWGAYWQWDPKEVWTFVIWAVYAAYMHSRATAGVDARKSMYIALAGYAAVIINFTAVNLVSTFVGMHNYSGM
ncbi:MAG: c-type cytochrome biogenesis protein CcsB [Intrasporangium sp.]|uniref:c-type cytochrome biogenesis protein CcsB n=1 Tax=Intrasporangium sp. TaxID=1925024 RepID=UPI0026494A7F|nr:c-type cytochrome biogenesis protein CcsB [Intrasporangium sp.]MDN5796440.1 c-type cytochrome biogenesis protein CcsB [Intrasporangium sp.]